MWVWSGLTNQWRALGGLSPIANKRDKQLVPTDMAGERCSRAGGRTESLPCRNVPGTRHAVRVTEEPRELLRSWHFICQRHGGPAEWRRYVLLTCQLWVNTCILFEMVPPFPCCRKVLHSTEYAVTAVGSSLSLGNYFIISLSAESCKLITFIADFVYTSVY